VNPARRRSTLLVLVLAAATALGAGGTSVTASDPEAPGPNAPETWRRQGREAVSAARALSRVPRRARNVVLFVGDGMSLTTVAAARILAGQLAGGAGEEHRLAFERLPHLALLKTYNTNQQVPDSAGTATAMLTGVKTRTGVLGVGHGLPRGATEAIEAHRLPTLFEQGEERGLATGVVTTTTLTHATPASAWAHVSERDWESDGLLSEAAREAGVPDIARQLVELEAGDGIDVALGGGRQHFRPAGSPDPEYPEQEGARRDGRDLVREWREARPGRASVWTRQELLALDKSLVRQVLGLFEPAHMKFEAQRATDPGGEPSLAEMTGAALELLAKREEGYLLLVEGGRIDHGHHASSAYLALHDTLAFSEAVAATLERVDLEETLVVVTADHGHTLTFAGYPTRGNPILGLVRGNDGRGEPSGEPDRDALGLPYTTLGYANGPGYTGASDAQPEGPKQLPHRPETYQGIRAGRPDLTDVDTTDPRYLQESAVPRASETHSGEDVPLYAGGPGAHLFHGVQEQSYVYHAIVAALGW